MSDTTITTQHMLNKIREQAGQLAEKDLVLAAQGEQINELERSVSALQAMRAEEPVASQTKRTRALKPVD